jgi:hypothetical protein
MEDDLKKNKNGRRPKKNKNGRRPKKKKNLFSIPFKSRGKPFLGLAQLSKIFSPTAGRNVTTITHIVVFRKAEIQKNAKNVECKICGKIQQMTNIQGRYIQFLK